MKTNSNFSISKITLLIFLAPLFSPRISGQYNVSYESAKVLGKGQSAISGHYAGYSFNYHGNSEKLFNLAGIRFTRGISESFNLCVSYGRIHGGLLSGHGANYLELAPKISLSKGKVAFQLPLGVYFAEGESSFIISPKLLFTYRSGKKFDLTFSPKAEILLESPSDELIEFSLGAGFSSNLDKWAIRPEIGIILNPGEDGSILTYGLGFTYNF
jgi:hypothetical protein